jgi:large subunit ribosomal protein L29
MKKEDIRELTTDELRMRLEEERTMYSKLILNHAISPIENPMKIRVTRRGIAMILTELANRQRTEQIKTQS